MPFTSLALGFALQVALDGPRGDAVLRGAAEALAAGLAIGALYAINSWSYPVVAGLLVLAIATWLRSPESAGRRVVRGRLVARSCCSRASCSILPFQLAFDPAARGIGWVDERRSFTRFAGDQALLYGLFAGPLAAAFAARVLADPPPAAHARVGRGGGALRPVAARAVGPRRASPRSPRCSRSRSARCSRRGSPRRSGSCGCWSRAG